MIRHIVAWNFLEQFSDTQNKENAEKIKKELENLKNLIPQLVTIEVIIDPLPTSSRSIVLNTLFQTEADLGIYQEHPEHKRVGEFIKSVTRDRVCLDLSEH